MTLSKRFVFTVLILSFICWTGVSHAGYLQDAYASYKAGKVDESIEICEEGLSAAPNDEELAYFLGQMYLVKKDFEKAGDAFKKTITLDPEKHKAHYNLGICYLKKRVDKKPKPAFFEASQAFLEAVKLEPDNFKYLYQYGHSLLMQRKFLQSQEPLQKAYATEKGATDYNTIIDLGLVYQATKQKDNALIMFEKAHDLDPESYTPLKYLGNIYMENEDFEKVVAIGEKLIQFQPDEAKGFTFRGYGQLRNKDFIGAVASFDTAISMDSSDGNSYFYRGLAKEGRIGTQANSYKTLIDDYTKAVNLGGDSIPDEWHYRLGHAYELEAMPYWDRAFRHVESRNNCLRYLRKSQKEYKVAGSHSGAVRQLGVVNERIRQLDALR